MGKWFGKMWAMQSRNPDVPARRPDPCPLDRFETGLLSPNGVFYSCPYECHSDLARDLGYEDSSNAMSNGYIHVSFCIFYQNHRPPITQDQMNAIFDWTQAAAGRSLPDWYEKAQIS